MFCSLMNKFTHNETYEKMNYLAKNSQDYIKSTKNVVKT